MSFLTNEELRNLGLVDFGKNVRISKKASIYNPSNISIGNNVRIDDFCVISAGNGGIEIGNFVHIAVFSLFIGAGKITLSDFCNISSRVSIYTSNDDYSGTTMSNPTVPSQFTCVTHADVFLGKHVIVGSGSIVLPGVTLEDGVAVGSLSLVSNSCKAFGMYAGSPAKLIKERKRDLLELEKDFLENFIK